MSDINKIIDKIKATENLKYDKDVAHLIGIKPDTLSQLKGRSVIPYTELVEYSTLQNVSLDWLLKDEEEVSQSLSNNTVGSSSIVGNNINLSNVNITNGSQHPKEVTNLEDDMLECYRALELDMQEYYYHKIKADSLAQKMRNKA